jgi:DNA-binding MarR family transcriptional regulator
MSTKTQAPGTASAGSTAPAEGTARAEVTAPAENAAQADDSAPALNRDILDSLTTLFKQAGTVGHSIADDFGIAPHDLLALFKLEGGLAMKELAQRMGCDASFVTAIADTLEKRGFIRREPSQRDRRIKNLMLTSAGMTAKERLMTQLAAKMPWCYALDEAERRCFLGLLRKMLDTPAPESTATAGESRTESGRDAP